MGELEGADGAARLAWLAWLQEWARLKVCELEGDYLGCIEDM